MKKRSALLPVRVRNKGKEFSVCELSRVKMSNVFNPSIEKILLSNTYCYTDLFMRAIG